MFQNSDPDKCPQTRTDPWWAKGGEAGLYLCLCPGHCPNGPALRPVRKGGGQGCCGSATPSPNGPPRRPRDRSRATPSPLRCWRARRDV